MTNPTYTDEQAPDLYKHIDELIGMVAADSSCAGAIQHAVRKIVESFHTDRQRLQAEVNDAISLMRECALYLECNDPKAPPLKRVHDFLAARATPNETKEAKS